MSSLEIEQMVSRLCSRRPTREYPFVDDTIEAEDILRMTNRMDDSSDSENENEAKFHTGAPDVSKFHTEEPEVDQNKCVFRRHSSIATMRTDSDVVDTGRREVANTSFKNTFNTLAQRNDPCNDSNLQRCCDTSSKSKCSPRNVLSHVESHETGNGRESVSSMKKMEPVKSWATHVSSERGSKETRDITKFKPEVKYRPTVSFSRGSYICTNKNRMKPSKPFADKTNLSRDHEETTVTEIPIKRPMIYSGHWFTKKSQNEATVEEKKIDVSALFDKISKSCRAAELTRPPPSMIELFPPSEKKEQMLSVKLNTPSSTKVVPTSNNAEAKTETDFLNSTIQSDPTVSPRSKFPRIDENKGKRYTDKPSDDMLIDQVASYNRNLKFRSK